MNYFISCPQINPMTGAFEANAQQLMSLVDRAIAKRRAQDTTLIIVPAQALSGRIEVSAFCDFPHLKIAEAQAVEELQAYAKQTQSNILIPLSTGTVLLKEDGSIFAPAEDEDQQVMVGGLMVDFDNTCAGDAASNHVLYVRNSMAVQRVAGKCGAAHCSPHKLASGRTVIKCSITGGFDKEVLLGSQVLIHNGRTQFCSENFAIGTLNIFAKGGMYDGLMVESFEYDQQSSCAPTDNDLYNTVCFALRDYLAKTGFKKVVLGLSGGIDSALVMALACDAIGAENVRAIFMPSEFTSDESYQLASLMAQTWGVRMITQPIKSLFENVQEQMEQAYGQPMPWDVTEENIQARLRGLIVMSMSNKMNELALCTSNKSEAAMGYGTLYGDLTGGYAPLIDLWKPQVVQLCQARNAMNDGLTIPEGIITREPSAELRPNQKDSDSLPPYDRIAKVLDDFMQGLSDQAFNPEDQQIIDRALRNGFKRAQGIPGPVVSSTPLSLLDRLGVTRGRYWN